MEKPNKKFGHLGFTLRKDDYVVLNDEISVKINKITGSVVKLSIQAPVDVNVCRVSVSSKTRSWRRDDEI